MSGNRGGPPAPDPRQQTRASLVRLALFGSVALLLASTLPRELLVASLSSLLWVGGIVSALVAAFLGERMHAPWMTRWDEAAVLVLASLALGFFVDTQAMMEQVEQMRR